MLEVGATKIERTVNPDVFCMQSKQLSKQAGSMSFEFSDDSLSSVRVIKAGLEQFTSVQHAIRIRTS